MKRITEGGRERIRLETWGELASHLGVEVRTAQRWEDRLGLPVRRLQGSQAVFAFADELDAWRAANEVSSRAVAEGEPPLPVAAAAAAAAPPKASVPRAPIWFVAAAVIAAFVVGFASGSRSAFATGDPVAFALQHSELFAINVEGSRVWTHEFLGRVRPIDTGFRPDLQEWWQRVDFDADGVDEIVMVVSHAQSDAVYADVLLCFTLDGRLRFSIKPELSLSFAAGTYTGPWLFWDVEAVPEDKSLWLAFEIGRASGREE
jgi:hypothetical protein